MAVPRPVLHLPLIAGACTAAYAAALVFVTDQQAAADREVTAERAPMIVAAATTVRDRADATRAVRVAADRLRAAGVGYEAALDESARLDVALEALAREVAQVSGAAAQLPDRIALPVAQVSVVRVTAPAVQAVTGASGR
jgi:hypothetical protein